MRVPKGVEVVSQAEAETAEWVVCARKGDWTPFHDNLEGICLVCGTPVIFRPDAPKRPPKICFACLVALLPH